MGMMRHEEGTPVDRHSCIDDHPLVAGFDPACNGQPSVETVSNKVWSSSGGRLEYDLTVRVRRGPLAGSAWLAPFHVLAALRRQGRGVAGHLVRLERQPPRGKRNQH